MPSSYGIYILKAIYTLKEKRWMEWSNVKVVILSGQASGVGSIIPVGKTMSHAREGIF